jgi:hypothetical protein
MRRLEDDRFFLMGAEGGGMALLVLSGEDGAPGASSRLPCEPPCVKAGVAGDSLTGESPECTEVIGVIG